MSFLNCLSRLFSDERIKSGILFFGANSFFVFLISLKYFVLLFAEAGREYLFYSVLASISHFLFLSFLPFILIFLPIYLLTKKYSIAKGSSIVISVVLLIILAIDAYVFSLYRFHLNSYVFDQLFGPASGQVFEFTIGQYLIVSILLIFLFLLEFFLFKVVERFARFLSLRFLSISFLLWMVLFLSVFSFRSIKLFQNDRSIVSIERHFPAVVPFYPNLWFDHDDGFSHWEVKNTLFCYPKQEIESSYTRKNLLIIGLDSWRYSTMDSLCSPHIYNFSKRAVRFDRHYSGSNGTKSGVFSLFYGLSGAYFNEFARQSISPILINELRKNRYELRLFPSASLRNPPLDQCAFSLLSDQCDPANGLNAWQRDVSLSNNFLQFLSDRDTTQPFFAFLFFDSLHSMIKPDGYKGPFQPSWEYAKYERLGKGVDPTEFLNLYKNMVYYIDSLVGRIFSELEQQHLLENTIIVITGDHAQEFDDNKHSFWGHNGNFSDAQIRVPLIYYTPECSHRTYNHLTAHYDIVPSLMRDLFSVTNPPSDYSMGKYLEDTTSRRMLVVDSYIGIGVIDTNKSITNLYYDGTCQLTDSCLNEDFYSAVDSSLLRNTKVWLETFQKK